METEFSTTSLELSVVDTKKIKLVFDPCSIIFAESENAYLFFTKPSSLRDLPQSWRSYHKEHTIRMKYENKYYPLLILPGALEMLQYFSVSLKDEVSVSFFSVEMNAKIMAVACKKLMQLVARNAKVRLESIQYEVFTEKNCRVLSDEEYSLQPRSDNNTYIPKGSRFWCLSNYKKALAPLFGNVGNVIHIDAQYYSVIRGETANHLKALYCSDFNGHDFRHARRIASNKKAFKNNYEFLKCNQFYQVNQNFYITGLLASAMMLAKKSQISVSAALEQLQVCSWSQKYQQALDIPVYNRYEPKYFEQGYLLLREVISPCLEFYSPFPASALDALHNHMVYAFINKILIQATDRRYPDVIYWLMHAYLGTFKVSQDLLNQSFVKRNRSFVEYEEKPEVQSKACKSLPKSSRPQRYDFVVDNMNFYIMTNEELHQEELTALNILLAYFPHASARGEWLGKFLNLNISEVPKKLLKLAANAYDAFGNTMLGIAAEEGSVEALNLLLTFEADLNTIDNNMQKTALHWAIKNRLSFENRKSVEAAAVVQFLLNKGAKTNLLYEGLTAFKYAENRGCKAAAGLIKENNVKRLSLYADKVSFGLFKHYGHNDVKQNIFSFLTPKDIAQTMRLNKSTRKDADECLTQSFGYEA